MSFSNLRMSTKLWLAVSLIIAALLLLIGLAGYRFSSIQAEADRVIRESNEQVETAIRWMGMTQTNSVRTTSVAMSSDPVIEATFKSEIADTTNQINELQKKIEAFTTTEAGKAQLAKIAAARKEMIDLRQQAMLLKKEGQLDEAAAMAKRMREGPLQVYLGHLADFVKLQEQQAAQVLVQTDALRANTMKMVLGSILVLIVLILVGAAALIRNVLQPLETANGLAAKIAQGDLSVDVQSDRQDEFGDLLRSLGAMNRSLGGMVLQVRQSTDSIALASAEIATGNNDLSNRTEQTASNLQHSASALSALTDAVQHSAHSAQQASSLAASASQVAQKGGTVVHQVVSTMEDINSSSKRIADIIGVIDGIAFQTNILALNAAVEAARAGEQGRGFAVVAGEVRSLAQRSAEAAREIKDLINASVERVETGARLVADAGQTMNEIVQSVQRVTDMIGEITAASNEQSSGIAEVNQAVASLDQMTQQNAALVEESAAAAQSLRDQADQLASVVSTFKVSGMVSAVRQAPRPVAAPIRSVNAPAAKSIKAAPAKAVSAKAAPAKLTSSTGKAAPAAPKAAANASASAPAPKPVAIAAPKASDDDWETF